MASAFRLDSVSPMLGESFRRASPDQRRRAAAVACQLAVAAAVLTDPEATLALDVLRQEAVAPPSLRRQLEGLVVRYDDEYLLLNEKEDGSKASDSLHYFSKARAASALAFYFLEDTTKLHEAIYEAIASTDEPHELVQAVERELKTA